MEEDKFKLSIQDTSLTIDMPETAFYIEGIQIAKRGIAMDIQKFIPDLTETKFVEAFTAEPKPKPVTETTTPVPTPETSASTP